jgi:hypothetical protein
MCMQVRYWQATATSLSQSHVARLAFAAVVGTHPRHRAKEVSSFEAGRRDHARICACQVRQPTTYLHSQSHHITRPSASSKDPLPHPSCNTKTFARFPQHKPTVSPNKSVFR